MYACACFRNSLSSILPTKSRRAGYPFALPLRPIENRAGRAQPKSLRGRSCPKWLVHDPRSRFLKDFPVSDRYFAGGRCRAPWRPAPQTGPAGRQSFLAARIVRTWAAGVSLPDTYLQSLPFVAPLAVEDLVAATHLQPSEKNSFAMRAGHPPVAGPNPSLHTTTRCHGSLRIREV